MMTLNRRLSFLWLFALIALSPIIYDVAHAEQLDRETVTEIAAESFGWQAAPYVARIAWCESNHVTGADTNWPYVGLMQVDYALHASRVSKVVGWRVTLAESASLLRDPYVNMAVAFDIWRDQGYGAWPVCRYR